MCFKLLSKYWKDVLVVQVSQGIELLTILKNMAYHLDQK
jgi:hypothetical protein